MKTLVIVGDHPRNLGLLNELLKIDNIEIRGLILFERDKFIPEANKNLSKELKKLWDKHFSKRSIAESKFFDSHNDYEKKISKICYVKNDKELHSEKTLSFIKTLNVDACFITGISIIKEPLLSKLPKNTINLHLGIIPFYKGAITMFWPFYFLEPTMAGTTYHIIDKFVDTGEIIHNNVPKLEYGDGMHDVASKAVVAAHKDVNIVVEEIIRRVRMGIEPKKDISLRLKGKLFLKSDWKPEMLNIIYNYYDDKIVDLYLNNQISCPKAKLIKINS